MAQKIEFIHADSLGVLEQSFGELVARYTKADARFEITPVGFAFVPDLGYVVAASVVQSWKTTFESPWEVGE